MYGKYKACSLVRPSLIKGIEPRTVCMLISPCSFLTTYITNLQTKQIENKIT